MSGNFETRDNFENLLGTNGPKLICQPYVNGKFIVLAVICSWNH